MKCYYLTGTKFQFDMIKKFMMVMVARQCEWTQCHWTVPLKTVKMIHFIILYENVYFTTFKKLLDWEKTTIDTTSTTTDQKWKHQMSVTMQSTETALNCRQCKVIQALWKRGWQFLTTLNIYLCPKISFLGFTQEK